jgi:chaperonin GroEL (HSP60 family)
MVKIAVPEEKKELLEKLLKEAEKLLKEGDTIQASEKFYKVTEEVIKILAEKYAQEVYDRSRWTVTLIEKSVKILKKKLGDIIVRAWSDAWDLHTKGFHEHYLDQEAVDMYAESIRELFRKFKDTYCGEELAEEREEG